MKKRAREAPAAFLLLALLAAASCSDQGGGEVSSAVVPPDLTAAAGRTRVEGWLEVLLPVGSPAMLDAAASGARTWFLLPGERALLCYDSSEREWRSFRMEGGGSPYLDIAATGDGVLLLSAEGVTSFSPDEEAVLQQLPTGFEPFAIGIGGGSCAVLGADGRLAIPDDAEGFVLRDPGEEVAEACSGLFRAEPDWFFLADGDVLCRYDQDVDLWQFETAPTSGVLAGRSGVFYVTDPEGSVLRRESRDNWVDLGPDGRLYPEGLILAESGVYSVDDPSGPVAGRPSFEPSILIPSETGDIIWAADEIGLIAHAALGSIRTGLPDYDSEMIACTMAGQAARQTTGATGGVMPVMTTGAGVFRIYESVSSRPDPFTEFPPLRRDLRRDLIEVTVEELRLVGITIDPVGGNQALVEDAGGVAFILYEGIQLANNTEVAEISENEVVVVQEVTVDYGAERGGVAIIPTIYTMRLHEEGGL
ncbi:hypothetical protein JW921_03285 [Candidatus Fermentibacterales bacterium]|nr:hypothetical protein [Candidatus Fermentibacterales bacterium]